MPDGSRHLLPGWPRYLSREDAARYVGVSARTFDAEVDAGWWPKPRTRGVKGTRLTWDRLALDAAADREAGLGLPSGGEQGNAPEPTADDDAALKGVLNAARRDRPKYRSPKAA